MRDFAEAASPEDISLLQEISYTRRQEARKAAKTGIRTEKTEDATVLVNFHIMPMGRQGVEGTPRHRKELRFLAHYPLERNLARLCVSRTPKGDPVAVASSGWNGQRVYRLCGTDAPAHCNTPCGTAVIGDAFGELPQVDAELVPYYRLIKDGGDTAPTDA